MFKVLESTGTDTVVIGDDGILNFAVEKNSSVRSGISDISISSESALKVIYLAIHNISKKWTMPIRD
jgi:hypothetical protein